MKKALAIAFGLATAVSVLVLATSAVSLATPLTFVFQGQVSGVLDDDSGTFGSNFAVGDPVTGFWSFDTTATQNTTGLPYLSYYHATFTATISGKTFAGVAEYRIFDDGPGGDGFSVINETRTYSTPALGSLTPSTFFVQFLGMPTTTLSNQNIVTNPAELFPLYDPTYAPHGLRLDGVDGSFGLLNFTVASVNPVPEPTTALLLLTGLGIIMWTTRSKAAESLNS